MGRRMVMKECIGHNEVPSSVGGRRSYSILVQFHLFPFVVCHMKNKKNNLHNYHFRISWFEKANLAVNYIGCAPLHLLILAKMMN